MTTDDNLYQKCEPCHGLGVAKIPPGGFRACRSCDGRGYVPVGVTKTQLDAYADRERALQGDPGLPEADRLAILLKLKRRVVRALGRLTADVGGEG